MEDKNRIPVVLMRGGDKYEHCLGTMFIEVDKKYLIKPKDLFYVSTEWQDPEEKKTEVAAVPPTVKTVGIPAARL